MPEGPEVAIFHQALVPFTGQELRLEIVSGRYARPDKRPDWGSGSSGTFQKSICHGKRIIMLLAGGNNPDFGMILTFGMTGRLSNTRDANTRVVFNFSRGQLFYVDHRNFGTIRRGIRAEIEEFYTRLYHSVPCALTSPELAIYHALQAAQAEQPGCPVGELLMDQDVVAGVGNYLRAEILYECRIHPASPIGAITDSQLELIARVTKQTCDLFFRLKGTTLSTFAGADGAYGQGREALKCYKRTTDPEGRPIESYEDSIGRVMWFCPSAQVKAANSES